MPLVATPPKTREILSRMGSGGVDKLLGWNSDQEVVATVRKANERYFHWDEFQHRPTPQGTTAEELWLYIKFSRESNFKVTPLIDKTGVAFSYWIPDSLLKGLNEVDTWSGRNILTDQPGAFPSREQYIISSLMEEAIASSQLEGAATTRQVAKEMLRTGRKPANTSEKMIFNNWKTMLHIRDNRNMKLTVEALCEIQALVTQDTLEHPEEAGRLRMRDDIEVSYNGQQVHLPPTHDQLPQRMQALCEFANDSSEQNWIHPVIKAAMIHFWIGYDHPFTDGNGRTARALLYWYMLSQGYSLFEFLSLSRYFLRAPGQYVRSYLYTETDANDLTYFISHNVKVICLAFRELRNYLKRKQQENYHAGQLLRQYRGLNLRQRGLLYHAVKNPGAVYTIQFHRNTYGVVYETARHDLLKLTSKGLLRKEREGKEFVFYPSDRLFDQLRSGVMGINKP